MALSENQKVNLEKSRYDGGTSFVSDVTKINAKDDPMLVVGIGGTGVDGLLRVKQKVSEVFKTGGSQTPKNIKFLAIDTDLSSFGKGGEKGGKKEEKAYMGVKLTPDEQFDISFAKIGEYLDPKNRHLIPDYITEWLDPNITFTDATAGAGGVRQVSRICLFQQADALKNKIQNQLAPLAALAGAQNKKVQVYVITGVSGGTGSGAFLDVAYIVQQTIMDIYNSHNYSTCGISMGYVVAPDVSDRVLLKEGRREDYIYANGYAALKELDYLMNLTTNGDVFRQQYSQRMIIESQNAPFDFVHLVSGSFINGTPVENYYDRALQTIAESIVSFMAADYTAAGAASSMLTPEGYQSNVPAFIRGAKANLGNKLETVGYNYSILGYSGRSLPVKDIMICLAKNLFDEVGEMMENCDPTDEQVKKAMSAAYMDIDLARIGADIQRSSIPFETLKNNPNLSKEKVLAKGSVVSVASYFNETFNSNKAAIDNAVSTKNVEGKTYVEILKNKMFVALGKFFTNDAVSMSNDLTLKNLPNDQRTEFGPAWANGLLVGCTNTSHTYILHMIQNEISKISQNIQNAQNYVRTNPTSQIETKREEAAKSVFNKQKLFDEYIDAYVKYYNALFAIEVGQRVLLVLDQLQDEVVNLNKSIFGSIKESLTYFKEIFDKNIETLGDINYRKTAEGASLSWNLISYQEVDRQISEMLKEYNLTVSANNFYKFIWANLDAWGEENFNAFDELRKFIGDEFNSVLSKGIESYLHKKYEDTRDEHGKATFDQYLQEVLAYDMKAESTLMFDASPIYDATINAVAPYRAAVLIPAACTQLITAFNTIGGCSVGTTQLNTKISWTTSQHGLPLYAYGSMHDLEKIYEERRPDPKVAMGCHLYMNKQSDKYWFDLPAIIPASDFKEGKPCASEIGRRDHVKNVFERAIEYGVIKADKVDGFYKATFAGDFDVKAALEECKVDGAYVPAKLLELNAKVKNYLKPENDLPYLDAAREQNELVMIYSTKTEADALKWFYICYGLAQRVEKEVEKYEKIKADFAEVSALCQELEIKSKNVPIFVNMLVIGAIDCTRLPLIYYLSKDNNIGEIELGVKRTLIASDYLEFSIYKLLFENRDKTKINDFAFNALLEEVENEMAALERSPDYGEKVGAAKNILVDMQKKIAYSLDGTPLKNEIKAFYDEAADAVSKL